LGTFCLSSGYYDAYYLKALKVRRLIKNDFDRLFENADLVVGPTSPTPPFKLGEKVDDPLAMYLSDIFTVTTNLAGLPAISIPCAFTQDGLPIGLQLQGRAFEDTTVLRVAHAFEKALGIAPKVAPVV
jgi:aspartyl-tRNA(Asn)/glutamyl-tRNA(Gln) amidotransferase subunit A